MNTDQSPKLSPAGTGTTPSGLTIDSETLANVKALVAQQNYASAYAAVSTYISATYPLLQGAQQDVATWINTAFQVNSGDTSSAAVLIRLNNKIADFLENGLTINLFGPEEQASSNAVAQGFFTDLINGDGQIPSFPDIIANDAKQGLDQLNLRAPFKTSDTKLVGISTNMQGL